MATVMLGLDVLLIIKHRRGAQKGQGDLVPRWRLTPVRSVAELLTHQSREGKYRHAEASNRRSIRPLHWRQIRKDPFMMKVLIAVAVVGIAAAGSASAQDVEKGQNSFKKCMPCHRIGPGAKNLVGPELNGLDGRKSGTVEGFNYSDANKNSGITWNEAQFKEYIKDPRAKIPGTKMTFAGIKNEDEITDLWAYLKQFDAQGNKK
jgi:cytochrome c